MTRRLWPSGGLWRHPDFLKLWTAETISVFGSQFTALALPLVAVLLLDASTFAVSALFVVEFLPFILSRSPPGVWVDRLPRKPILVIGDLGRAALLGSIPLAYVVDALTLGQLYVVAFLVGICTVFFDVAYQSYLPSLVEREQLVDGNSKLEISRSTSQLAGPGTAGGLIGLFGAPFAMLLDAISYAVSAVFLFAIRRPERMPAPSSSGERPSMLADAREGLSFVVRNRYLRAISMCTGTSNFFFSMSAALIVVYAVRELDMSAGGCSASRSRSARSAHCSPRSRRTGSRAGSASGPTILSTAILFSAPQSSCRSRRSRLRSPSSSRSASSRASAPSPTTSRS